jgi:hypothetical protein
VSGEDTATDGGLTQAQEFKIEDACHEFLRDHPGDPAADEITDALAPVIASLVAQARAEERERCVGIVEDWAGNYPPDVFPGDSDSRDAIAGTALRTVLPRVAERLRG